MFREYWFTCEKEGNILGAAGDGHHVFALVPVCFRTASDTCARLPKVRFPEEQVVVRV